MLFLCALQICFDYLNISIFSPETIYQKQQKWDCVKSNNIMVLLLFRAFSSCSRIHINHYLEIRYIYKRDLPSGHLSFFPRIIAAITMLLVSIIKWKTWHVFCLWNALFMNVFNIQDRFTILYCFVQLCTQD